MASSPKVWTPVEPRGHSGNRSPDRPYHAGQVTDRRALSIGAGNDPGALFCEPVSHRAVAPSASSRPRHRAALGQPRKLQAAAMGDVFDLLESADYRGCGQLLAHMLAKR